MDKGCRTFDIGASKVSKFTLIVKIIALGGANIYENINFEILANDNCIIATQEKFEFKYSKSSENQIIKFDEEKGIL